MNEITNEVSTWPTGDRIWDICRAIALHEGATIVGSVPDRLNNPGDLSRGDEHGQSVVGYETLPDGEHCIHFSSKVNGWRALRLKFEAIVVGRSKVYKVTDSWQQVGMHYATDPHWGAGVAKLLGVPVTSTPRDYIEGIFDEPAKTETEGN